MGGADLSDSAIVEAHKDVRNDKTATNWLLLNYESDKSDILKLTATGEGGLDELTPKLNEGDCAFAYARVEYANDKESKRVKFVLIVWIGSAVKIMRKAKVSVHAGEVKQVLNSYSIEVSAGEQSEVDQEHIVTRLRKAGGASYDGV
ncbi:hypothetical protein FRB94_001829 [Tulasnella sp. JGI-2019a]|nr:hypothetical protein FRB93_004287 [Tulasnella sp. JGI-2019a]KAG9005137.1 hypothetical protein FRB94_001829 [Tulasnella sp. JGI-2019a]KAG9028088.1 hypothetical protein FRB95_006852 [Tulasnella sp. JGI-2019a]